MASYYLSFVKYFYLPGFLIAVISFTGCTQAREMSSYSLWDYLAFTENHPNHLPIRMPRVTDDQAVNTGFTDVFRPAYVDFRAGSGERIKPNQAFGYQIGGYGEMNNSFPWEKLSKSKRKKEKEGVVPVRANVKHHESWSSCEIDGVWGACNDSILIPCWVHDVRMSLFFGTFQIAFSFGPHRGFVTPEELESSLTENEIELLKEVIGENALENGWDNSEINFLTFPHSVFVPRVESN